MTVEWFHGYGNEFTYIFNLNKLRYHLIASTRDDYTLTNMMTCMYSTVNQTDLSKENDFDYMKVLLSQFIVNYPGVNIISHFGNSYSINGEDYDLSCIYPIATRFSKSSSGDLLFEVTAIDLSKTGRFNFHRLNKNELYFDFRHHNIKALVYIEFKFTEKDLIENDDRLLFDYLLNYYEFDKD